MATVKEAIAAKTTEYIERGYRKIASGLDGYAIDGMFSGRRDDDGRTETVVLSVRDRTGLSLNSEYDLRGISAQCQQHGYRHHLVSVGA